MARDIPVGNGDLLITFDHLYRIRDLYSPRVGRFNHTDGNVQRFGVWADGRLVWIEHPSWSRRLEYKPDTLVTHVTLTNHELGLEIVCHDAVDYQDAIYFRQCIARDLTGRARDVRLFFHFDLSIRGTPVGDTANYDPSTNAVVVYKDDAYFLINAQDRDKSGIDHWAIGTKRVGGAEGTWRDAEDGLLGRNAISQGSVDATVGFNLQLAPGGEGSVCLWIACGSTYGEVKRLNRRVLDQGPTRLIGGTEAYWRLWCRRDTLDLSPLPERLRPLHTRSMLVMRTQIDNRGAILAANDSDVTAFGGDHYSYCWMRDGALVAASLVRNGQADLSRRFFRYAAQCLGDSDYFLHKYNTEAQLASSWHPWMLDGQRVLPIQQDETALVVWALRRHYEQFRDVEFVKPLYHKLVIRPAEWLCQYRDINGLPLPSWDLWEERRGVHTFTVAAVVGALVAAADFARDFGDLARAEAFAERAARMRQAMRRFLYSGEHRRFARSATHVGNGSYRLDMTHDSANFAVWAFGGIDPGDPIAEAEMRALRERLWVKTAVGGCARYEHDYFHQVERQDIAGVPGNPWIICTLWHAQHAIAKARSLAQLHEALPYLEWAGDRARPSGVLAEQFNPHTGDSMSVSPLTWSHATYAWVVADYVAKHHALSRGAGRPDDAHAEAGI